MTQIWAYRADIYRDNSDLIGFDVVATDGEIGKVDEHSADAGSSYLVVDTGFWIFGKKRLIPAGVVERVDYDDEKVFVRMTKDEIKDAPDYEEGLTGRGDWDRDPYDDYYTAFWW